MNNIIIPNSTENEKSTPTLQDNKYLSNFIERTNDTIQALETYMDILKEWQEQNEVTIKEFEQANDIIFEEDLQGWATTGWITIYDIWRRTSRDFKSVEQ